MWVRNIKWIAGIAMACGITVAATIALQNWQRSHFTCTGDLMMEYPDVSGDISVRYVFNGDNGVAILRGEITDTAGANLAVNQNVWFKFSRKGNDYFLESDNVASSSGETIVHPLLSRTLPNFYLKGNEPFYFSIIRLNSSTWQFYTSRSPSVFCRR